MDRRIIDLPIENAPDNNDFLIIDDGATNRKVRSTDIARLSGPVTSVNTETGDVVLTSDDIDDTANVNKFVTQVEKDKLTLIKTDQGISTFLSGDGAYRTVPLSSVDNVGTGSAIYKNTLSNIAYFKTISAGSNITINATGDTILISSNAGGGTAGYAGASPSNVTVGGLPAGTVLTGKTYDQLFEQMLVTYLSPSFTSFAISAQATLIEVGTALSGSKTFTWSTSNSSNINTNSIGIRDVTANTLLGSSLANDGTESLSIGTVTNTSPISQAYRAEGVNTNSIAFNSSNFTIQSLYPYFYGTFTSGGAAAGVNRPTADQSLINSGTKVVAASSGGITINFSSNSDQYIWFAIPTASANRTTWFVNALNNGSIGGAVSAGGNLFPANDTVSINSPTALWSGISYRIYISNYQSAVVTNMTLS
jgi:hypothetical protein